MHHTFTTATNIFIPLTQDDAYFPIIQENSVGQFKIIYFAAPEDTSNDNISA